MDFDVSISIQGHRQKNNNDKLLFLKLELFYLGSGHN